ncbi:MAG: RluA family pseudouridine synthase [Xanthomonadales bacterium]|nr:RluA family pseudouridine synthase [Xanthomonadales bacterium]
MVTVPEDRDGQRIDNFLLGQLKGVPRSLIYRLLRTGQVRVDGKRAKAELKLSAGQNVRIPPVKEAVAGAPLPAPERLLSSLESSVLFEDEQILVLDKPSGLASHGGSGLSFGAIEALRQGRPTQSLELVHRLDRDTSGLLLVAKARATLLAMQRSMSEGEADKRYLALLAGDVEKTRFDVNAPLRKQVLSGGERLVQVSTEGKPSLSHFRVIEGFGVATLVEVRIETGRTHQIRVHAAHVGHPVVGDDKYGDTTTNRRLRDAGLQRLFLHAAELRMPRPSGGQWHWRCDLPVGLQRVLSNLRDRSTGSGDAH